MNIFFAVIYRWWAQVDSNHRPRAYQARALTTWAMSPCKFFGVSRFLSPVCPSSSLVSPHTSFSRYLFALGLSMLAGGPSAWWRWWESNPWPPACRAGALPAELHPHIRGFSLSEQSLKIEQQWDPYSASAVHSLAVFILVWSISETFNRSYALRISVTFSIERRWSSRTFRYGYLVTT